MVKRVSITGPESTGKSWLTKKLAVHFNTVCVDEYSVKYLPKINGRYTLDDIEKIAKEQLQNEEQLIQKANKLIFCDTDILVNKIWSKVVFGDVPEWIIEKTQEHKYDLYLLCLPDLKWEKGPFRENPFDRDYLFELYEDELIKIEANYRIVAGYGEKRFQMALTFVNELF